MNNQNVFERFNDGSLCLPESTTMFADIEWSKHPVFDGVELKHLISAKQTGGLFSYHLVRIAPDQKIGLHIHENQLETHEVVGGSGSCINNGVTFSYQPGVISIFAKGTEHEIIADQHGLCLFAKFFPALC